MAPCVWLWRGANCEGLAELTAGRLTIGRTGDYKILDSRISSRHISLTVDGKAVLTLVRTGASNLSDTMISEGLSEGDIVATGPYRVLERLKQGDAIREETAKDIVPAAGSSGSSSGKPNG